MGSILIRDGFNFSGKIPARPGIFPEVNFKYRPAIRAELADYLREIKEAPKKETEIDTALVLSHVKTWDAVDEDGRPLPIDAPTLNGIWPNAFAILLNHVTGYTSTEQAADLGNSAAA